MSAGFVKTESGIAQLTTKLQSIGEAGLPKPENCLLSDYLNFLVEQDLLQSSAAANIESLYYSGRYGSRFIDEALLADTLRDIDQALLAIAQLEPDHLRSHADSLRKTFSPTPAVAAVVRQPVAASAPSQRLSETPLAVDLVPSMNGMTTGSRLAFWSRLVAFGFLWTMFVLLAGYYGHDHMSAALQRFQDQKVDPNQIACKNRSIEEVRRERLAVIKRERERIMATESDEQRATFMRLLASRHLAHRDVAEFIHVYRILISQNPDSAMDKNTLAWAMLRSREEWYRDPVQAQQLAEEAVAAEPKPHHLDTLAEACFQNGDIKRAIALEEQALEYSDELPEQSRFFFTSQLKRFRKALENPQTASSEKRL